MYRSRWGIAVTAEARYQGWSAVNSTSDALLGAASEYVAQTRRLNSLGSTTEETFYPAIRDLLSAILRMQDLPFEVRTGTSEERERGTDRPDFVLADAALFVGVFGEVKKSDVSIGEIAVSTDRDDQIGRYPAWIPVPTRRSCMATS